MQQLPLDRSSLAQTAIISLVTVTATAMLGLVLAYWTWVWFAPRPESRAPASAELSTRATPAKALFGAGLNERPTSATTGVAVKLLGVVATSRVRRGYAVMQLEGRDTLVVREGSDVSPGVRLAEVHPDHVVLERGGIRETLAWPAKPAVAAPQTSR